MIADASWFNELPEGWKPIAFKRAIRRMGTGLNPRDNFILNPHENANIYYVTIKNFKNGRLYLDEKCDMVDQEAWEIIQTRSDLHKNDILFASISEEGNAYILNEEPLNWNINESVFCIRVDEGWFIPKFFAYMITNQMYYSDLRSDATGTTFLSIKQNKLKESILLAPPIQEQRAIVSFLDSKCAAIDEAIERHKKAIENLEEYRKATISSVIIRGIDKNANMKPSGIPGIGEIPNHYQPTRIKFLGTYRNGLTYSPSDVCDENEGTLVLRSSNIQDGKLTLDDNVYVKCDIDERLKVRDGDILICARNGSAKLVGKSAVIKGIVATYGAFMMVLRTNADPQYMYYVLNSRVMDVYRASFSTTTVNQLTAGILGNLIVPYCPDRKEQIEIAKILDLVCGKIAEGINKHKNIIDKLQEYRKSIIYHAVTGKIDCRGANVS